MKPNRAELNGDEEGEHYLENILSEVMSLDGSHTAPINVFIHQQHWEDSGPSAEELQELYQSNLAQLEHVRELLAESEELNVRLTEQVKLLKEEIRRAERNHERTAHVSNSAEYLKNVVMKYLAPEQVNDQRQQLLPVLSTVLKLSPEEMEQICVSMNNSENIPTSPKAGEADGAGWTGYLGSFLS